MGANAQTSVPAFVSGQVLTAQQQTQINTGVPVFATTVTRDAAFGGTGEKVLAQGQLAYIEATDVVQYYNGTSWATLAPTTSAVAQIKSTAKTDTFATSTTLTWVDITGLSQSITPTSASNKVLVQFVIGSVVASVADRIVAFRIVRGSTAVGVGDSAGDRTPATSAIYTVGAGTESQSVSGMFLDSPGTTSATTYKIQVHLSAAATVDINKVGGDNNSSAFTRQISTITCSEVAP